MRAARAPRDLIGPYLADQARARGHLTSAVVQQLLGCDQVAACNALARHAGPNGYLVRGAKGRPQRYHVNPALLAVDGPELVALRKQREMLVERIRRVQAARLAPAPVPPAAEQDTRSASAALAGPGRGITPVFVTEPQATVITPTATSPRGPWRRPDGTEALQVASRAGNRLVPYQPPHTRP